MIRFNGLIFLTFIFLIHSIVYAKDFDPQSLIVKTKEGQVLPGHPKIISSRHLFKNYYVVWTKDLMKVEVDFSTNRLVEWTDRNYKSKKINLPQVSPPPSWLFLMKNKVDTPFNDPGAENIWSHWQSTGISLSRAYKWPERNAYETIIVAVVDTGVEYTHEDLKDIMWKNQDEIPNNGIDDDENGYVDDIYGISPLKRDENGTPSSDPMDYHGHGTHVAGIIGATQNNNVGVAGIASNVKIMAIRAVPGSSDETDVDVVESFLYAAKNGAKIINCSFGKRTNEGGRIVAETIKHIGDKYGVLVIAAAGNESRNIDMYPIYPGSFPNNHLLVVGATTSYGQFAYWSNYGTKNVDVAAPGASIYSTLRGNGYAWLSGTSMASPTTAGVAAEVLSNFPHLGPLEVKKLLIETVSIVGTYSGKVLSGGRVDLYKALLKANEQ